MDRNGNRLYSKQSLTGSSNFVFTSPSTTEFDVCFTNVVLPNYADNSVYDAFIELTLKTGSEAMDYTEIAQSEKLKPIELELRKMENVLDSVVSELDYMKAREEALRDTNGFFFFLTFALSFYPRGVLKFSQLLFTRVNF